jgi:hypothetical protein
MMVLRQQMVVCIVTTARLSSSHSSKQAFGFSAAAEAHSDLASASDEGAAAGLSPVDGSNPTGQQTAATPKASGSFQLLKGLVRVASVAVAGLAARQVGVGSG